MAVETDDLDLQTNEDHRALIQRHDAKLRRSSRTLARYDKLYEGDVPLKYMAPEIAAEFGDRIAQLVVNIAEMGVLAYNDRLEIDGIRLDPSLDADDTESQSWADLDMDLVFGQVTEESLALGMSMAQLGQDEDGQPVVTAESPLQMTVHEDHLRRTRSAVKRWRMEGETSPLRTLHLPYSDTTWGRVRGRWQVIPEFTIERDVPNVGVYQFTNRGRILSEMGKPVFYSVVSQYEALNKMATDMMVAGEFHALPRRWATNVAPEDFEDEEGNSTSPLQQLAGAIWAVPGVKGGDKVELGQFDASDLRNFHESIKLLLQIAGHMMGLPAAFTSFATDNPAAEGAIKAGEIRLIKGCERIQTGFSPKWRRLWRDKMELEGRGDEAKHLSMIWRDPSTPTIAQKADAIVKLVATKDQSGHSVVPVESARELMGFSSQMRDAMKAADKRSDEAGVALLKDLGGS